jgi:predicted nucleotidyltransferase
MKEDKIGKEIKKIKKIVIPALKRSGVVRASIFGSFVKGKVKKSSDVDILIKFKAGKSLLDLARLELELEKKLRRKVELLTYESIHPLLKERILEEEVVIL